MDSRDNKLRTLEIIIKSMRKDVPVKAIARQTNLSETTVWRRIKFIKKTIRLHLF